MTLNDLLSIESAAILAAASALTAFVGKAWPVARRLARFLDDVQGEPERPGVPARPGWGERLAGIEGNQTTLKTEQREALIRLKRVETSQGDVVTRLERVEDVTERVRAQTENSHATNLRDDLDAVADQVRDLHHRHGRTRRKDTP